MDDQQVQQVLQRLGELAENMMGTPMVYQLIDQAQDLLVILLISSLKPLQTESNIPKTDCVICLCPFEEGTGSDEFMKTQCVHYFHRLCDCCTC